jgi:hypothetical protein
MSESWSDIGPQDEDTGQGGTAWMTNGKGVAESPETPADAPEAEEGTERVASAVAVSDPVSEATEPTTDDPQGAVEVDAVAAPVDAATSPDVDPSTSFLTELVRAMQTTAGQQRSRVLADTDLRRSTRVEEIRGRETAEAARMRELAAEDQAGIDAWAETEIARIKAEQQLRADALQADLETSLGQHRELIAQEIDRVEGAITTFRTEVEAFFDALEHETDPVAIAQLATRRPVFPSLDTVPLTAAEQAATAEPAATAETTEAAATAETVDAAAAEPAATAETAAPEEPALPAESGITAEPIIEPDSFAEPADAPSESAPADEALVAEAEPDAAPDQAEEPEAGAAGVSQPQLVGVMDYSPNLFGDPWRDLPEKSGAEDPGQADAVETNASAHNDADPSEAALETPADHVASAPRGRSLLQAVPALRPMGSWLGRQANSDRPDIHS